MKNKAKYIFVLCVSLVTSNVFAYNFSVENKTDQEIKADVYLESRDPNIATVSGSVVIESKHTASVTLSIVDPKESYTNVSDAAGHKCSLRRYRNIRVIESNNQFVCLPR